jgi:ATP-dependent Clp protease ATP-binding subunit ClpA
MFERFTERARQVVVLAQQEARVLKHQYIGTEHLLLGLLGEKEGVAAHVLVGLGFTLELVRSDVVKIAGSGQEVTSGQIPFTPNAKRMLELSLREALSLGHNYIGTEHLLLGLAREWEGVAARVLLDHGAEAERVRSEVMRVVVGPEYAERYYGPAGALASGQAKPTPAVSAGPARAVPSAPTPPSFAQALARALEHAAARAGDRPLDVGDLLLALLEQPDLLISSSLTAAGIDASALREAIEAHRRGEG